MKQTDPQFKLRLPQGLKDRLESAATSNHRSLTAEIVARLEASFQAQPTMIAIDELHRCEQPAERALEMVEMLKAEILAIMATPKK